MTNPSFQAGQAAQRAAQQSQAAARRAAEQSQQIARDAQRQAAASQQHWFSRWRASRNPPLLDPPKPPARRPPFGSDSTP